MPDLEDGIYKITNCEHRNNATLFNGNADEPVRGAFPKSRKDEEKVH